MTTQLRFASHSIEALSEKGRDMQTAVHTTTNLDRIQFFVLFAALYPLLLTADGAKRLASRVVTRGEIQSKPSRSMLLDARDNASIAISYAVWARKTLQAFVR